MASSNFGNLDTSLSRGGSSVYSLTFDEFQNVLREPGINLESMNMEELLKNIWTAEESQAMAAAMNSVESLNEGLASQLSLQKQTSFSLPRTLSGRTVEDVWKSLQHQQGGTGTIPSSIHNQRQMTLGEVTLEEFLTKAGIVMDRPPVKQAPMNQVFKSQVIPPLNQAFQSSMVHGLGPINQVHKPLSSPSLMPPNHMHEAPMVQQLIPSSQVQNSMQQQGLCNLTSTGFVGDTLFPVGRENRLEQNGKLQPTASPANKGVLPTAFTSPSSSDRTHTFVQTQTGDWISKPNGNSFAYKTQQTSQQRTQHQAAAQQMQQQATAQQMQQQAAAQQMQQQAAAQLMQQQATVQRMQQQATAQRMQQQAVAQHMHHQAAGQCMPQQTTAQHMQQHAAAQHMQQQAAAQHMQQQAAAQHMQQQAAAQQIQQQAAQHMQQQAAAQQIQQQAAQYMQPQLTQHMQQQAIVQTGSTLANVPNGGNGPRTQPQATQHIQQKATMQPGSSLCSISNNGNGPSIEASPGQSSPLNGVFGVVGTGNMGINLVANPGPARISFGAGSPVSPAFDERSPGSSNLPMSLITEFGNGQQQRRKRCADAPVEKVIERRQRRMIKNRESAARSRARKQAYTVELEAEVSQLKEENMKLLQKQEEETARRKKQILAFMPSKVTGAGLKGCSLKRTHTGPW
ncbi:hypothetical protein KP509_24G056700 [Ceratopteris richardii]|uniref:BZIP domain-containing protein n=1 Tax=Ceratopteris richardii TaxID=49495 RepID=A0A8T2RXA2_CERRI|nr:hypothetical protein KP509_24G056700 [Ceratopteris richardii]